MIDVIASFDGRIAKVHGPARSGKTEALARRAVHLLDEGVDPTSILVEVTNGFAAQAFRRRLAALAGDYTVLPGHGSATTLHWERAHNPFMQE